MSTRWSAKKLKELLEYYSDNQKAFKTKPSGRLVKTHPKGYAYCTHGYFVLDGAYGGWQLDYVLPYSTGQTHVSRGGLSAGRLAEFLQDLGISGLRGIFKELEKHHKPYEKARFEREKAKYKEEMKKK